MMTEFETQALIYLQDILTSIVVLSVIVSAFFVYVVFINTYKRR